MGATSALSTTGRTLKRNTALFAAAFVLTVISLAPSGVNALLPPVMAGLVSLLLSGVSLFVTPFFMGGLLSMADEGLSGTTRLGTFVRGGKANYVRLLGAMVLFGVLLTVVGFVVLVVGAVVGAVVFGISAGAAGQSLAGSGVSVVFLVLLVLLGALAFLLPVFVFQFYAAAVVVSDLGIVDSFKRSAAVVRRNLVSTLGYTVVVTAAGLVTGVASASVSLFTGYGTSGTAATEVGVAVLVPILLAVALVSTVVSAFGSVYQVAFYEDCLDSLA
ncbi:hypothetical protein M0R89_15045 [Halorussus limi]|uniref:DUF7847 domain-containing protein n=1 Tax=Halorussus limi TaxID=2938695 RepID=A0A8U0HSK9_9EURY|nr:hypothetical protein [Halorussus limi]UPV73849.1 hypothetical protein M0R89_15045 [Halorussus limi]